MAEFVCYDIRNPSVAAAYFEVPVGKPKVQGVFARNGATVTVKGVVQDGVHATGKSFVVAARDGIIDGFCVSGNLGGVRRIFNRINKLEMFRACGFPLDIALVSVKTGCGCESCQKQRGTCGNNALDRKFHNSNLEI